MRGQKRTYRSNTKGAKAPFFNNGEKMKADKKAIEWAKRNKWFGRNKKLTYEAFYFHDQLVKKIKINPNTKKYYQLIDLLMEPFLLKKIVPYSSFKKMVIELELETKKLLHRAKKYAKEINERKI